ncbi:hypothetical protein B9479_006004 [Cryptococcus floricola]|uniref:RRM domain-containing protein n=1 Tax=Cryptococcus floricola TaxID=2591691 RepID=A0A5D3APG9_9TREE|nr:hypothetical protein B9479_006004 [Cryptococcus floricola]
MSGDKSTKKTPKAERTPEEQAKRDAKKAAKKAAAAKEALVTSDLQAEAEPAGEATPDATTEEGDAAASDSKKRKREGAAEGDELEIDVSAPAPLSKAEIRAARKRAKRGDNSEARPKLKDYEKVSKKGDKDEKDKAAEALEGKGKRQNSIWIGNLAFKTTSEGLKEWFENGLSGLGGKGEGSVTRINLPKKNNKAGFSETKGQLQELSLKLSESPYLGRRVLIKKGDDHAAAPDARTPKQTLAVRADELGSISKRPETSCIYMGNLPFDITEVQIRDIIEENAPEREAEEGEDIIGDRGGKKSGLIKVRLAAFEDTGRCKGFAFLDFVSARHAKFSLANRKNHYFNGRKLNLEFASESSAKRSGADKLRKFAGEGKPKPRFPPRVEGEGGDDEERPVEAEKKDQRGKKWEASGRQRPGAALAMAKRENVGIVEGSGTKVTFD